MNNTLNICQNLFFTCLGSLMVECKASYLRVTGPNPLHISISLLITLCLTITPPPPSASNSQKINDDLCSFYGYNYSDFLIKLRSQIKKCISTPILSIFLKLRFYIAFWFVWLQRYQTSYKEPFLKIAQVSKIRDF